jgi:hypothetical protein
MPTSDEAWDTLVTAYEAAAKEFDAVSDVLLSHVQAKTHPTTVEIDAQEIARKILITARWALYGRPILPSDQDP